MAKIAVEDTLSGVKTALQNSGYEVVNVDNRTLAGCQCCVISGQDQNVMGIANAETQAPVINAHGLTTEEVLQQINSRVQG